MGRVSLRLRVAGLAVMIASSRAVVFISYSRKDQRWLEFVQSHLQVAVTNGHFETWDDRCIEGGNDWAADINAALWKCAAFILLVSRNSLTSRFILRQEIETALDAHWTRGLKIYPILVQSCDIEAVPWLKKMNIRPRDARALALYPRAKREEIMTSLAAEIRIIVSAARTNPGPSSQSQHGLAATGPVASVDQLDRTHRRSKQKSTENTAPNSEHIAASGTCSLASLTVLSEQGRIEFVRQFPIGPPVDPILLAPGIRIAFARGHDHNTSTETLLQANRLRRLADPDLFAEAITLGWINPNHSQPREFWGDVLVDACRLGPRMLVALIASAPPAVVHGIKDDLERLLLELCPEAS
jgi:hypothetical protein